MTTLPHDPGPHGPLAVRTRSLVKRFRRTTALDGVDLAVPEGSVYVLVGANGAGKTTTLRVLLDLVVPEAGSAEVLGMDTREEGPRVRARIGWVPEREESPYGWMRVGDLIHYHAGYYAAWDAAYADELGLALEIRPRARFAELSKGHQRRVQLLLAMAHRPPLLVLDEPTDGLDPLMREQVHSLLAAHLARFPTTLLVSTHLVHEAERLGDHLAVMRDGRIEVQIGRDALRRRLLRYHLEVPEGWPGVPALDDAIVRRNGASREMAWTIWGEEAEVAGRLRAAEATVRRVEPLTLEAAALALMERTSRATPPGTRQETITGAGA